MNNQKINFAVGFVISCLLIFSCKDASHQSDKDKKYHFSLHLNPGEKYYYTISNETHTTSEIDDKKIESANLVDLGLIYEVFEDTAKNMRLKITYDKLHIMLKNKDEDKEIDIANSGSLDPVEKLLSSIRGSSIFITMNAKGDVKNITGNKEISDKILASMDVQDEYTRKTVQDQLSKLIGEVFVKNNIEEGFKLFPDSAIFIGGSWKGKNFQTADVPFDAVTTYTLRSVRDGIAEVEAESLIASNKDTEIAKGYAAFSEIKVSHKGNFKADTITGMLLSGKSNASIEGMLQAVGRTVPVKIKIIRKIEAKKIS